MAPYAVNLSVKTVGDSDGADSTTTPTYPRRVKFGVLMIAFLSAVFTQYQAVGPCVFLLHAAFLSFIYIEPRKLLQWAGTGFVGVGLALSMSQIFRADKTAFFDGLSFAIILAIQLAVIHVFWLFALIHCRLARKSRKTIVLFCYPVIVCATYSLVETYSPIGSQGSLAYALVEFLAFVQVVSLFGLTGLNFIIVTVAASIAHTLVIDRSATNLKRRRFARNLGVGLFLCNWFFGSIRLLAPFIYQRTIEDTAIPAGEWVSGACIVSDPTHPLDNMVDQTEAVLARGNVRFVLWSEGAAGTIYEDRTGVVLESWQTPVMSALDSQLRTLAATYNATIGASYMVWANPLNVLDVMRHNLFTFYDPLLGVVADYSKRHPVPVLEGFVLASNDDVAHGVSTNIGAFNAAICFDLDYPEFIRKGARTGLLIQSANTWGIVGHFHGISSSFRAIENGMYLVRCGSKGPSGVFDVYGNALAYQTRGDRDVVYFQVPFGGDRVWTFYAHAGFVFDYFLYAIALIYFILFAITFKTPTGPKKPASPTAHILNVYSAT